MVITGCQYSPYAHLYTTSEPNTTDIIGTYTFDKQTVDYSIKEFRDSTNNDLVTPTIVLYSDNRYVVKNLPHFKGFMTPNFSELLSQEGTWSMTTVGSIDDGTGNIKRHWGLELNGLPLDVKSPGFMNEQAPYDLIFKFGDPDEGDVMIFTKK